MLYAETLIAAGSTEACVSPGGPPVHTDATKETTAGAELSLDPTSL